VLGLQDVAPLTVRAARGCGLKLVTFVPPGGGHEVLDAVSAAGAGRIGDYERCSFRVGAPARSAPGPAATPTAATGIGEDAPRRTSGSRSSCPAARAGAVVAALQAAHPYDEVAYDLVPLLDGAPVGFGRVGTLPRPDRSRRWRRASATGCPAPHLRYAGEPDRPSARVAIVGGAGDSLIGGGPRERRGRLRHR
jgi:hypothetical protein